MKNATDFSGYFIILGLVAFIAGRVRAGYVIPAVQSSGLNGTVFIPRKRGYSGQTLPVKQQFAYVVLLCAGGASAFAFGVYKAWIYKEQ